MLIQVLDAVWKEHLYALDHLRQGIGLRAYGQRDPLNEYKSEAFALFNAMLDELKERVTSMLARVELAPEGPTQPMPPPRPLQMFELHPEPELAFAGPADDGTGLANAGGSRMEMRSGPAPMPVSVRSVRADAIDPNDPATWRNAARNGPCPCGSGKKYKHCHGKLN
jgi:preprotein translocase subunit SecA